MSSAFKNPSVLLSILAGTVSISYYVYLVGWQGIIYGTVFGLIGSSAGVVTSIEVVIILLRNPRGLGPISGVHLVPVFAGVIGFFLWTGSYVLRELQLIPVATVGI